MTMPTSGIWTIPSKVVVEPDLTLYDEDLYEEADYSSIPLTIWTKPEGDSTIWIEPTLPDFSQQLYDQFLYDRNMYGGVPYGSLPTNVWVEPDGAAVDFTQLSGEGNIP